MTHDPPVLRWRLTVHGTVQGVGFRPYVHALANRLRLGGVVGNDTQGVFIEVEGEPSALAAFRAALPAEAPPLAVIERVDSQHVDPTGQADFVIVDSHATGAAQVLVPPDVATCADCLRELFEPGDRRYRYSFTNCTNCGPRFTIVRGVPYDRPATTMAGFAMCTACAREYHDPLDRRFHAQPICCPRCGPRLSLIHPDGREVPGDPIRVAARLLQVGHVLAVKGLGGYHLVVDATSETAAAALRARKHREDRPFAVMVADLAAASRLGTVGPAEHEELAGAARPIVLLPRLDGAPVAASVAPGQRWLGVMLAYTPLHHLLAAEFERPLVFTSGNVSDEPIAYDDDDARFRLARIAEFFLTHDRPIHRRVDDSVVRVISSRPVPIRRSRGYVPRPLGLPWPFPRHVLACGAELKNTFSVAKGRHIFVSHHIGDLENYETLQSFIEGIEHFQKMFGIDPAVVAHDLHPEYLSTKYALDLDGVDLLGVQHHHAHVASCLADNGVEGPVIGVAFDGLGYGTDGTMWGGEFLVADLYRFERVAHLDTVPMPGGAAAIREPWRMAAAYLDVAFGRDLPAHLAVVRRNAARWDQLLTLAGAGINAPVTSSMGRLFDAVAAIVGLRDTVTYEGQAAVELEQCADRAEDGDYGSIVVDGSPVRIRGGNLVAAVADDLAARAGVATVSARFHNTVARVVVEVCALMRKRTGLSVVALSGGVFQNVLLVERATAGLTAAGFEVLTHSRVPTNDGGISLGQAAVAGACDRAERC